jgi:predicted dehydrogenase
VHAYVEKPLADSSADLGELLERAERDGVVVATGYNLRFHPALEAVRKAVRERRLGRLVSVRAEVGQYLPDWHPGEDFRASYAARADLGGGALLTLSHELDYVRWIVGEVVECEGRAARFSELVVDVDDVAEIVCRHESGTLASVHVDFLDRAYNRRSRWVGEEATIAWEWGGAVRVLPDERVLWEDPAYDVGATYLAALTDFLACVRSGARPRADGRDGLRVVELCEAIRR